MKKQLSLLLAVLMLLSVFSVMQASAAESTLLTSGDFEYTVSNNKATIIKYNGTQYNEYVPEKIDNYPVTAIGAGAFANNTNLRTVTLYANVTSIGNGAFTGMRSDFCLKYRGTKTDWDSKVTVGTGNDGFTLYRMRFLYNNTFWYCVNTWDNISITASCDMVEDVTIPDTIDGYTVTTIAGFAFDDDWTTKTVRLPDTVTNLGYTSIGECSITSLYIGRGLKTISSCAFDYNSHLTDIYYNGTEAEWKKIEIEEEGNERLKEVTMHYVNVFKNVDITGVVPPAEGQKPSFTVDESERFTVESFSWYNVTDGYKINDTMTYEAGKTYRATFKLKVKQGYRFDFSNREASVNGKAASSSSNYSLSTYDYMVVTQAFTAVSSSQAVTDVAVTGLEEPKAGSTPDTKVTVSDNANGITANIVSWDNLTDEYTMGNTETFEAGKRYQVTVLLMLKSGRVFSNAKAKINYKDAKCSYQYTTSGEQLLYASYVYTVEGEIANLTPIERIQIEGYKAPAAGEHPALNITPVGEFTITKIDWTLIDHTLGYPVLTANDVFEAGKDYTLEIYIQANDGYKFDDGNVYVDDSDSPKLGTFTIDGKSPSKYRRIAVMYATLTETPAANVVTEVNVTVAEPKAGEKPQFSIEGTEKYSITNVEWRDFTANTWLSSVSEFREGKEYGITFNIEPKEGYTLSTDSRGYSNLKVKINGKDADETYGYVSTPHSEKVCSTYNFPDPVPAPAYTLVNLVNVTGIDEPVVGATPDFTADENAAFSTVVTWANYTDGVYMDSNDKFEADKSYTLVVGIYAKDGYKFDAPDNQTLNYDICLNSTTLCNGEVYLNGHTPDEGISAYWYFNMPEAEPTVLPSIRINGIVDPKAGEHPNYNVTADGNFTVTGVVWAYYKGNYWVEITDKNYVFKAGEQYSVDVQFKANDGYAFDENLTVFLNEGEFGFSTRTLNGKDSAKYRWASFAFSRLPEESTQPTETPTQTPTEKPTQEPVWGDWTVDTPATVDEDGIEIRYDQNNPANFETRAIPKIGEIKYSGWKFTYNSKTQRPSVAVYDSTGKKLTRGVDYTIIYPTKSINAGLYVMSVSFQGKYAGLDDYNYHIQQAKNPMTVKVTTKTVKYSAVKKKAVTVTAISVKKAQGTVTYKKLSGSKYLTVNAKTGKITVKKGTKKGTYKIKVKVTAKGNSNYKSLNKNVVVTIKVK